MTSHRIKLMKRRVKLIRRVIIKVIMNDLEFSEFYFSSNNNFQGSMKRSPTFPLPACSSP